MQCEDRVNFMRVEILLPACSLLATTPRQTWLELCPLCPGKDLHETPGLNAGRQSSTHKHACMKTPMQRLAYVINLLYAYGMSAVLVMCTPCEGLDS